MQSDVCVVIDFFLCVSVNVEKSCLYQPSSFLASGFHQTTFLKQLCWVRQTAVESNLAFYISIKSHLWSSFDNVRAGLQYFGIAWRHKEPTDCELLFHTLYSWQTFCVRSFLFADIPPSTGLILNNCCNLFMVSPLAVDDINVVDHNTNWHQTFA